MFLFLLYIHGIAVYKSICYDIDRFLPGVQPSIIQATRGIIMKIKHLNTEFEYFTRND